MEGYEIPKPFFLLRGCVQLDSVGDAARRIRKFDRAETKPLADYLIHSPDA
jgi:hypothetical protein